jgi:peptide methionine sulfoxide reductase MsrA
VGYSGGIEPSPTYESILDHTEAVLVEFDPNVISYRQILEEWRRLVGTPYPSFKRQYRNALFHLTDRQKQDCNDVGSTMEYVDVEPATKFYMAEDYHQNFYSRFR